MNMKTLQSISRMTYARWILTGVLSAAAMSCKDITDTQLPDGVEGPATYNNRQGAMRLTQATVNELSSAITRYIISSGLLTDELGDASGSIGGKDQRSGRSIESPPHNVRTFARLARGVVRKYVSGETSAWQARLFMYEAYAEILIADGWCSGVPLSTLDFEGDWTYKPGSTTDEIYMHAIQLLDSAAERAIDSLALQSAIRVLKARSQLALGRYAEARQTILGVHEGFRYDMRIAFDAGADRLVTDPRYSAFISFASVSNHEGGNGLPYRSSDDNRTRSTPLTNSAGVQTFFPVKYQTTGDSTSFTLTSGIEAQLILAEAALHENNAPQMMTILNSLRTSGTYTVDTIQLGGGGERIDTLWNAGSGGVPGLHPFTDHPATTENQLKLLFSERAAWLFLTGSRQGDLRRLVRKYGMDREQVYPTGIYTVPNFTGVYGTDISFSLDDLEFRNPLFKGCQYAD